MTATFLLLAARLDWGLGNPNKTAALIAILMVAVWALPFLHRPLFWLALTLFTGLGVCLLETSSRGGTVALAFGLSVLLGCLPRPWPRARIIGCGLAVWAMIGAAVWLEATHRFGQGIVSEDQSISHRLLLWRAAPRMMVDAPGGWGFGNAGEAFMQWYQPLERTEFYRTLVNSHLTWLVELNWAGRGFYVLAWLAVLALCWPGRKPPQAPAWLAVPLGVWVAFAVAAWFSSVAESPWLWIAPGVNLACVLVWRVRAQRWPQPRTWAAISLGSCAVLGAFAVVGLLSPGLPRIRLVGSQIVLGDATRPEVWVVTNPATLGKAYGRTLRRYFQQAGAGSRLSQVPSVGFVSLKDRLSAAEVKGKTLVAAGTLTASELVRLRVLMPGCAKLILLNPAFYPQDLKLGPLLAAKVEVIAGEFGQTAFPAWTDALKQPVQSVEGAGDFLPCWPELVLIKLNTPSS